MFELSNRLNILRSESPWTLAAQSSLFSIWRSVQYHHSVYRRQTNERRRSPLKSRQNPLPSGWQKAKQLFPWPPPVPREATPGGLSLRARNPALSHAVLQPLGEAKVQNKHLAQGVSIPTSSVIILDVRHHGPVLLSTGCSVGCTQVLDIAQLFILFWGDGVTFICSFRNKSKHTEVKKNAI